LFPPSAVAKGFLQKLVMPEGRVLFYRQQTGYTGALTANIRRERNENPTNKVGNSPFQSPLSPNFFCHTSLFKFIFDTKKGKEFWFLCFLFASFDGDYCCDGNDYDDCCC
jgi:hypothetical protein